MTRTAASIPSASSRATIAPGSVRVREIPSTGICADTSGRLDGATLEILALARRVVLVCEPTLAGAWLAKEKARLLRSLELEDRVTVVLNRWSKDAQLSISDMEGLMGLPIDHRFPESPAEIRQTVLRASEVSPSCEWGQALAALSEDLTGDGSIRQKQPRKRKIEFFSLVPGRFAFQSDKTEDGIR